MLAEGVIDLLREGERPPIPVQIPEPTDYLVYVAQATATGWNHLVYAWQLPDPLPNVPIPLLGSDEAILPLGECFTEAYDRIAADEEAEYQALPPGPALDDARLAWIAEILKRRGPLRPFW